MSKHTPGPWFVDEVAQGKSRSGLHRTIQKPFTNGYVFIIRCGDGATNQFRSLATVFNNVAGDLEQSRANARLIASAPEMLEALKAMVKEMKSHFDSGDHGYQWEYESDTAYGAALRAIQKAEGAQ